MGWRDWSIQAVGRIAPPAAVAPVLGRHRISRRRDLDRPTGLPVRYVRDQPGELIHLDTKTLGRVPTGGGHRLLGRAARPNYKRGPGYEVLHVAVDDASRLAFAQLLPDGRDSG